MSDTPQVAMAAEPLPPIKTLVFEPRKFYLLKGNENGPEELTHICLHEPHPTHAYVVLVPEFAYKDVKDTAWHWKDEHDKLFDQNAKLRAALDRILAESDKAKENGCVITNKCIREIIADCNGESGGKDNEHTNS